MFFVIWYCWYRILNYQYLWLLYAFSTWTNIFILVVWKLLAIFLQVSLTILCCNLLIIWNWTFYSIHCWTRTFHKDHYGRWRWTVLHGCTNNLHRGWVQDWTKLISDHVDTYQQEISIRNPIQANGYLASIALNCTSRERRVEDSNQIDHNSFTIHQGYIGKDSKFVLHTILTFWDISWTKHSSWPRTMRITVVESNQCETIKDVVGI